MYLTSCLIRKGGSWDFNGTVVNCQFDVGSGLYSDFLLVLCCVCMLLIVDFTIVLILFMVVMNMQCVIPSQLPRQKKPADGHQALTFHLSLATTIIKTITMVKTSSGTTIASLFDALRHKNKVESAVKQFSSHVTCYSFVSVSVCSV